MEREFPVRELTHGKEEGENSEGLHLLACGRKKLSSTCVRKREREREIGAIENFFVV